MERRGEMLAPKLRHAPNMMMVNSKMRKQIQVQVTRTRVMGEVDIGSSEKWEWGKWLG